MDATRSANRFFVEPSARHFRARILGGARCVVASTVRFLVWRRQEHLNRSGGAQLLDERAFRLTQLVLFEILADRIFCLREIAADALFVLVVEELHLGVGYGFWFYFSV